MNVEKQVKRAVRRMLFWRLVGDFLSLPRLIFFALTKFFSNIEQSVFQMELDAARQYYGLTSLDLARANGDADRYRGIRKLFGEDAEDAEERLEAEGDGE